MSTAQSIEAKPDSNKESNSQARLYIRLDVPCQHAQMGETSELHTIQTASEWSTEHEVQEGNTDIF